MKMAFYKIYIKLYICVVLTNPLNGYKLIRRERNLLRQDFQPTECAPVWLNEREVRLFRVLLQHQTDILRCDVTGRPRPTVTWYKNGQLIQSNSSHRRGETRSWVSLKDVLSVSDSGNYTCVARNKYGSLHRSYVVDIVVRYRGEPQITEGPRNQSVTQGSRVKLTCRYFSDLEVYVEWIKYKSDNNCSGSDFIQLQGSGWDNVTDESVFVMHDVTVKDSGLYSCSVSNSLGSASACAYLQVIPLDLPHEKSLTQSHSQDVEGSSRHLTELMVAGLAVCVVSALTVGVVMLVRHCTYVRPCKSLVLTMHHTQPCVSEMQRAAYYNVQQINTDSHKFSTFYRLDLQWEILQERITLHEPVGEGAFGKVYRASLSHINDQGKSSSQTVAVKMLNDNASRREVEEFAREIEMMKCIGHHKNIISFIGCSTRQGAPKMLVEFATHGNLRDYLRKTRQNLMSDETRSELLISHLLSFSLQISCGMSYLTSKKIIHRDLALRNVLLCDGLMVKIADFGLTRSAKEQYQRSVPGRFPIKWMAPESLTKHFFSSKTDIWSYGVVLWEIFSCGDTPYRNISVESLSELLLSGYRLSRPALASRDLYDVMLECWSLEAEQRPSFSRLTEELSRIIKTTKRTNLPVRELLITSKLESADRSDHVTEGGQGEGPEITMTSYSTNQYSACSDGTSDSNLSATPLLQ